MLPKHGPAVFFSCLAWVAPGCGPMMDIGDAEVDSVQVDSCTDANDSECVDSGLRDTGDVLSDAVAAPSAGTGTALEVPGWAVFSQSDRVDTSAPRTAAASATDEAPVAPAAPDDRLAPSVAAAVPAGSSATDESPHNTATANAAAEEYLVWTRDRRGATSTQWIQRGPDGAVQAVARRSDVVVFAAGRLWTWRRTHGRMPEMECAWSDRDQREAETGRIERYTAVTSGDFVAHAMTAGEPDLIAPVATIDPHQWTTRGGHDVDLLATVGPYAFVRLDTWSFACGAMHGFGGPTVVIWDLGAGAEGSLETDDMTTSDDWSLHLEPMRQSALQRLAADARRAHAAPEDAEFRGADADDPGAEATLEAMLPHYATDGTGRLGLRVTYVFSAFACYGCGGESWGSNSRATLVPSSEVPARLAPFASPAETVRLAVERALAHGRTLGGYSVIAAVTAEQRNALLAEFARER